MYKHLIAGIFFSSLTGGAALAQTATQNPDTPVIDQRMNNQQSRVDQGLANGSLTQGEATRLQNRDASISAQAQADAAKDGSDNLTAKQRANLRHRENRTSRTVYRKKHNARTQANPTGAPVTQ